jgi:hypothetical protein
MGHCPAGRAFHGGAARFPLPPGRIGHSNNYAANLDGLVTFTNPADQQAYGYAQVFRSGAVEGVDLLGTDENTSISYLTATTFENTVVSAVRNYLKFTTSLDLGFRVFVFLSFCGMTNCLLEHKLKLV